MKMGTFPRRMGNCLLRLDAGIDCEESDGLRYVICWDK